MTFPVTEREILSISARTTVGVKVFGPLPLRTNTASAYGTRFNTISSHYRLPKIGSNGTYRPYKAADSAWHLVASGVIYTLPDTLPGSANVASSTSTTLAARGGVVFRSFAQDALVQVGVRKVVLNGTGGLTSAGAWNTATAQHPLTAFSWITADDVGGANNGYLLYPSGVAAGDMVEFFVAFRTDGLYVATPGYLAGWELFEPNLSAATPR